jgi:hypothetical protein
VFILYLKNIWKTERSQNLVYLYFGSQVDEDEQRQSGLSSAS